MWRACEAQCYDRKREREIFFVVEFCLDSLVDKKKDPRGKGREGVKGRSIE